MTTSTPKLKQLFYGQTPMVVYKRLPKFLIKFMYALSKLYWKKRNPNNYLKSLCSIAATISSDNDYPVKAHTTISCAFDTIKEMTQHVELNASLIQDDYNIVSLPTTTKTPTWLYWCQALNTQEHIKLHAYYVWILTTACQGLIADGDSFSTSETIRHHQSRLINWAYYFESIIEAKL